MKKYENIIIILILIVLLIGGFIIIEIIESKNKSIILQNKNDYEIFDKCYLIEDRYYCEKSN